jgi:hypothetical protein
MYAVFWLENLKGRDHSKTRHRWEDNIRTDLKETGWEDVNWDACGSGEGPVVGSYEHGNEPCVL